MIKKAIQRHTGFTLIEIMIVISIMAILATGIANIDWNRLSDRQKSTILKNRIVSQIETVRNNALFGKAVTNDLIVPETWRVLVGSGGIVTEYSTGSIFQTYDYNSLALKKFESISNITCDEDEPSGTGSIIIRGANMSLSGACDNNNQILKFDIGYKNINQTTNQTITPFTETISVNIVNGLIEDVD